MRRALALLVLLSAAGCSSRERSNPLDPLNPRTGGRPAGFAAVAGNAQVLLQWDGALNRAGLPVALDRRAAGETVFTPLAAGVPPDRTSFLDVGVENGVDYRYLIRYQLSSGDSPSSEDLATPSPVIPWVAEAGRRSLVRLSADGRHIAVEEPGFLLPTQIAVDRARDNVWMLDAGARTVVVYLPSIGARVTSTRVRSPACLAIDPADGSAWISDTDNGEVVHLQSSGNPGTPPTLEAMQGPLGMAISPVDRTLWVCDRRASQVRRYAPDGTLLGVTPIAQPSRVAIDSILGEAWVTSFEARKLFKLSPAGARVDSVAGFQGPVGVGVDPYRGRVWIADPVAGQVIAVLATGVEEFRASGMPGALELAVEAGSGEAWVTATGRMLRLAVNGAVVVDTRLADPAAIALDRFAR